MYTNCACGRAKTNAMISLAVQKFKKEEEAKKAKKAAAVLAIASASSGQLIVVISAWVHVADGK
jgi:hypothetical protein